MPLITTETGKKVHVLEDGRKLITVIPGDGIGPECVEATLKVLEAAKPPWPTRCERRGRASSGGASPRAFPRRPLSPSARPGWP